jgi:hypothetical protein
MVLAAPIDTVLRTRDSTSDALLGGHVTRLVVTRHPGASEA